MNSQYDRRVFAVSRRDFGKRVAMLGSASILPSHQAARTGRGDDRGDAPRDQDAPGQPDRLLERLSPEGRLRFDTMWQSVIRRHGNRLTDEQKTRMRKIIANNVKMLEPIYAVPLKNGDAPATVLRLDDADHGAPLNRTARPRAK